IKQGQSATLSWQVYYASSVNIDGTPKDNLGSMVVTPAVTTTYTLSAFNAVGSVIKPITIEVIDPTPEVEFEASRTTINQGDSITLSWNVSNDINDPSSVTIDGDAKDLTGELEI